MPRVFLITGCSTGFGQHLVQIILDAGDIAVGMSPNCMTIDGNAKVPASYAYLVSATARNPSTLSFQNTNPKTT